MNTSEIPTQQRQNLHHHKVSKNRLLLLSLANIFTFLCAVFSMIFYQWISIKVNLATNLTQSKSQPVNFWINLLFVYDQKEGYCSYSYIQESVCWVNDIKCQVIFYELQFIGWLSFFIFMMAILTQAYDFFLIIKFFLSELNLFKMSQQSNIETAERIKNNFRNLFMIFTYVIGTSLNYFGVSLVKLEEYSYGISFWIFFGSLIMFVLFTIWENRSIAKLAKREIMIRLLQKQRQIKSEQLEAKKTFESNSSNFSI